MVPTSRQSSIQARHRGIHVRRRRQPPDYSRSGQYPRQRARKRDRIARRVGGKRRSRGADRPLRRRPDRGGARACHAALRLGAIGGVVNASNQRIPDVIPRNGFSAEMRGRARLGRPQRGRCLQDDRGRRQLRRARRRLLARRGRLRDHGRRPPGEYIRQQRWLLDRCLPDRAQRLCRRVLHAIQQPLRHPRAEALNKPHAHRHAAGEDPVARRVARARLRCRGHTLWLGSSTYRHNEVGFDTGAPSIGSRFTPMTKSKAASKFSICPSRPRLAKCAGAVGIQLENRKLVGQSFEGGDSLLDPARTRTAAAFWFENCS